MTTPDVTILLPQVQSVLERLHALADSRDDSIGQHVRNGPTWQSVTVAEKAALLKDVLMPVSRDAGRFLYGVSLNRRSP